MHRIDSATALPGGLFTEGDPMIPIPATEVDADWLNAVQAEIIAVIAAAGITLDKATTHQLRDAILDMMPDAATTALLGLVKLATASQARLMTDPSAVLTPANAPAMGLEVPVACLPWPTVATAGNVATVTPAAKAGTGGTVSLSAGVPLVLGMETRAGYGHRIALATSAWTSPDMAANSLYYVRAQVAGDGSLTPYVQVGTWTDVTPASLKGTPNAGAGGGFDSTVLDVLLAQITTGAAGTVPVVLLLANADRLSAQFALTGNTASTNVAANVAQLNKTVYTNWARKPVCKLTSLVCNTLDNTVEAEPRIAFTVSRYSTIVSSFASSSDGYYRDMAVNFVLEA